MGLGGGGGPNNVLVIFCLFHISVHLSGSGQIVSIRVNYSAALFLTNELRYVETTDKYPVDL